jgi:serine/threonine protein kinase
MNQDEPRRAIDEQIVDFEKWCEQHQSKSLDEYVLERKLDTSIANELQKFFAVEKAMQKIACPGPQNTNADSLEGLPGLEGKRMGQYRFLERLGSGGMGTVWLADQLEPVERKVAIKLIRPGLDFDVSLKRFAQERQAMASLSHPNIAKVLNAGTFDSDRPYIVMEYFDGMPITAYCDLNCLSLKQRLELFLQLCNAIQYSHQKGLLHRDIKPGNVLVTQFNGKAHVKVIDFGLSKAFQNDSAIDPSLTHPDVAVGSPLWMSPEQATGQSQNSGAVDTRTDIYSLGVILYQLITNTTPIRQEFYSTATYAELIDAICEKPTPYPSVRMTRTKSSASWVCNHTGTTLSNWQKMLRNDLDWIAIRAMEKEPDRRYATAAGMAEDIRRFLNHEPVVARPPSTVYRFRKIARKHRAAIIAASSIAAMLLLSAVVALGYANRAIKQTKLARQEADRANNMANFMTRQYAKVNPNNPGVQYSNHLLDHLTRRDRSDGLFQRRIDGSNIPQSAGKVFRGIGKQ